MRSPDRRSQEVDEWIAERDAMRARLDTLERRCARLRNALSAALVVGVLGAGVGGAVAYRRLGAAAAPADVLESHAIVVRDARGVVRAALGPREDGGVALILSDESGTPRSILGVGGDDVPALGLSDASKRLRAAVAVAPDGSARVAFFDDAERMRAALGTETKGTPALSLFDGAHRAGALLRTDADGAPNLRLLDHAGQARVSLGLAGEEPSLVILDGDGAVLSRTPARERAPQR